MAIDYSGWITQELMIFRDSVTRFVEDKISPSVEKWRTQGFVEREFWRQAAEFGLLAGSVPEKYGGLGGSLAVDAILFRELSRSGDSSWGVYVHNFVTHYLVNYGTEEQKTRFLPRLASADLVAAIAMTEPGAGSDLLSIKTRAERRSDKYCISGTKTFISNGQTADLICVVAKTDVSAGSRGVSLLLVETEHTDGFSRGRPLQKLGMKGQDTSELHFDSAVVPVGNLLGGEEGAGFRQLMEQLPWERLTVGLTSLGLAEFVLEQTLDYVKQRKTFGQRLIDFQNTRFRLAECKTRLEVMRSFLDHCTVRLLNDDLDTATASMAKWWSSEALCEIVDECVQLFGGYGYMLEYPVAHAYVDSRAQKIYGGTNEIMKEIIARSLDQ